ncbi:hypothetical protein QL285_055219 [Trifolium repens]|nr:hypothetical protein QL285_055219 [Trifolium repens]
MVHHANLFLFLPRIAIAKPLCIVRWGISLHQTSFSDSFLETHSHCYHLGKIVWRTGHHLLVIEWTESIKKQLAQLFFFQRWTDLCSKFSPPLCILFDRLFFSFCQSPKFIPIWGQVRIVVVLSNKSIGQIIESTDISTIKVHVPP